MPTADRPSFEQALDALRVLDVRALDDTELRDTLVLAEQVRNATEAVQARIMVEMRDRAHRADLADGIGAEPLVAVHTGAREEFVVDEIAAHLRCTRVAASHRFAIALAAHAQAPLREAWGDGRLDARKVQVIGELLHGTDPFLADTLAAAAAGYAETHTGPQLRVWLTRRVMTADPAAAEERRQHAMARRRVSLTPLPDGVAEVTAHMPAVQARQIYDTLTALAHATDGADARTLDQRRSDALFDVVTGRAAAPTVSVSITVPAAALMAPDDATVAPIELEGFGPLPVEALGDLPITAQTRWRRLLTDDASGILIDVTEGRYRPSSRLDSAVRARDLTCRFPGCRRPATTGRSGVDLDHVTPWPHGPTSAAILACLCRHHHRLKHSPGWELQTEPDGTAHWNTPTGHRFTTGPWQYTDPADDPGAPPDQVDDAA